MPTPSDRPEKNSATELLYALRDNKAEHYGFPMRFRTNQEAIRGVVSSMTAGGSLLASNPEDFALYLVGEWEANSGSIIGFPPVHVINCIDVVPLPEETIHLTEKVS